MPDGKEVKVHHNHLKPVKERQQEREPQANKTPGTPAQSEDDSASTDQEDNENTSESAEEGENTDISNMLWMLGSDHTSKRDEQPCYITRYGRKVKPVCHYQA